MGGLEEKGFVFGKETVCSTGKRRRNENVGARAQNNVLGLGSCPRTLTSPRRRIRLK